MPVIKHVHNGDEVQLMVSDVAAWNDLSADAKHDQCERHARFQPLPKARDRMTVSTTKKLSERDKAAVAKAAVRYAETEAAYGVEIAKHLDPEVRKLRTAHQEARARDGSGDLSVASAHFARADAAMEQADAVAKKYALDHVLTVTEARRYLRAYSTEYQELWNTAAREQRAGYDATLAAGGIVVSNLTTTTDGRG